MRLASLKPQLSPAEEEVPTQKGQFASSKALISGSKQLLVKCDTIEKLVKYIWNEFGSAAVPVREGRARSFVATPGSTIPAVGASRSQKNMVLSGVLGVPAAP